MKTTTRHLAVVHSTRMVVAVALLLSCFASLARAETCTNQNLYGTYFLTLSGFRTFLTPPQAIAFSPIAVGGTFRWLQQLLPSSLIRPSSGPTCAVDL